MKVLSSHGSSLSPICSTDPVDPTKIENEWTVQMVQTHFALLSFGKVRSRERKGGRKLPEATWCGNSRPEV